MHPAAKIIVGLILILIGLALFVDELTPVLGHYPGIPTISWLSNFFIVLTGIIPIFLILVGLFVVWLEADELKSQQEMAREVQPAPVPVVPVKAPAKRKRASPRRKAKRKR